MSVMKSMAEALSSFGASMKEAGDAMREMGKLGLNLPKKQEPNYRWTSTTTSLEDAEKQLDNLVDTEELTSNGRAFTLRESNVGIGNIQPESPQYEVQNFKIQYGTAPSPLPVDNKEPVEEPLLKKLQKTRSVRCL